MTTTQTARLAGFTALLQASGESVVLPSGATVTALIDRGIVQQARRAGLPDFTTKASASIELLTPLACPRVGEVIKLGADSNKRFRIKEAFSETGYSLRFTCEPYEATS